MKAYLLYFMGLVLITGCKGETPIDDLPLVTPVVPQNKVEVIADMTVEENDVFQIFYTEDGTGNFGPLSVRVSVAGRSESQQITFVLPDDAIPSNIRFDIGQNPDQEEMIIKGFTVKYNNKSLKISSDDFFKYFTPGDGLKMVPENKTILPVPPEENYDPILFPTAPLTDALKKLVLPTE